MQISFPAKPSRTTAGFALPAILVVVGALLILAVASLLIIGIERNTARSYTDRQRAELASKAGLDDVRRILKKETLTDDFVIVQGTEQNPATTNKEVTPYLYIAKGSATGGQLSFRYQPLFSTETTAPTTQVLTPPRPESLVGSDPKSFTTHPWFDSAKVSWVTIKDPTSKIVSRYAYWVEDLQGKVNAQIAGNPTQPTRAAYPLPASRPADLELPQLSSIEVGALDPAATNESLKATASSQSLTQTIVNARPAMLSPDSVIGATDVLKIAVGGDSDKPALVRDEETGLLENPIAAVLEREVSPVIQSYQEQALIPYSAGITGSFMGQPKLNLNRLLNAGRSRAVTDLSRHIDDCLPNFDTRKGGFPDNYLQTLAAGAFDYADTDNDPTISQGAYLGIDAYPHISETVLQILFSGSSRVAGRNVQRWTFRLFIELWNMTNQPVKGSARFTYEVKYAPGPFGAAGSSSVLSFDNPTILNDKTKSTHDLELIGNQYYTQPKTFNLAPDEYRFEEVAKVEYTLPDSSGDDFFSLKETPGEYSSGLTMKWNNQPVQIIPKFYRDSFGLSKLKNSNVPDYRSTASIPGHTYFFEYGIYTHNMGDPRISNYLRNTPLGENSYPRNSSPGRRNIRRGGKGYNTYDDDPSPEKRRIHARVLPSEWPDGGHDSPVGPFTVTLDNGLAPTNTTVWPRLTTLQQENAVQRISNLGVFYSATELGRVYDPILWRPAYSEKKGSGSASADTALLFRTSPPPELPVSRNSWPEVTNNSSLSVDYGGGNTLRIGRPEHERFDRPGERASQLLDIFHVGMPNSTNTDEREGNLTEIKGNINVNTAGKSALRAMAAGFLAQDPELRRVTNWAHDSGSLRPQSSLLKLGAPTLTLLADQIADAMILRRPFASTAEIANVRDNNDNPIFGNRELYSGGRNIQWSDAAAEEVFARVYDASTIRSRNFRVWVIGQAVTGSEDNPVILSESRKVFTVFADPGERKSDGTIDPLKYQPRVTYENDF